MKRIKFRTLEFTIPMKDAKRIEFKISFDGNPVVDMTADDLLCTQALNGNYPLGFARMRSPRDFRPAKRKIKA